MSTSESKTPTSFFDLPLELRQMVYDYFLPNDGILTLNHGYRGSPDPYLRRLCEAGRRLHDEAMEYLAKRCRGEVVVSQHSRIPIMAPYDQLSGLHIYLDYCEYPVPVSYQDYYDSCLRFVSFLQQFHRLQKVIIIFREPLGLPDEPPECWYRTWGAPPWYDADHTDDGLVYDFEEEDTYDWTAHCGLQVVARSEQPVFEHVLRAFEGLPICERAIIMPLDWVTLGCAVDREMWAILAGVEMWLEGLRESRVRGLYEEDMMLREFRERYGFVQVE